MKKGCGCNIIDIMARTAEFEFVEYRKEEMIHASTQLIHNYARYSDLQGTGQWTRVLLNLAAIIRNSRTEGIKWATPGLNITFSGIPRTRFRIPFEITRLCVMPDFRVYLR